MNWFQELNKLIYLVGSEQKLHFQQIFEILDLLGFKRAQKCFHLSSELLMLPEGRMASREGRVITYSEIKKELTDKIEKDKKIKKKHNTPFFSTIVPAYNEEKSIVGTLTSLVNLDYPNDKKEIVVVNDGSTDGTQELVEKFIRDYPTKNITLLNQKNQGKAKAMNNGLNVIKGEFFACLDADSFVHSNALQEMLPYFEDQKIAAVCPLLKVKKPENVLQKVQWTEYIINMFYKLLNSRLNCIHVTPGPFSVYKTETIKKLGGYDENTITEDLEIALRLQKHNYKIKMAYDSIVYTSVPQNFKQIWNQRYRKLKTP